VNTLDRDLEHLLDDDAVARMLGISRRTLQRQLKSGAIPPPIRSVGRQRLWTTPEADLARQELRKLTEISRKRGRQLSLNLPVD
jgi:predicted site-specific integrase-resolvase